MQELVSFISIMLGVIVLTAWVMWLLLRPSGDTKTKEFASESARDGLTLTVIENNELKNRITRLERELKVLMSAGYGKTAEEKGKGKGERLKVKDEGLKIKDEKTGADAGADAVPVGGASRGEKALKAEKQGERLETKDEGPEIKDEGLKTRDEGLKIKDKKTGADAVPVGGASRGEKALKAEKQGERFETKDEGPEIKDEGLKTRDEGLRTRDEGLKTKDEGLKIKDKKTGAGGAVPVGGASRGEKAPAVVEAPKSVEMIQSSEVAPLSEAQRITDEAEKKKIADYLASVAETTERQMKEVEALDEEEKALEEPGKYPDDDLRKIKGIGPHLEGKLKKAGISSYQQIAEFTDEDIAQISRQIGFFPRRINRDNWVEQAKALVGKD